MTENDPEKLYILNMAKERYSMKMEILTNSKVVDDAICFIAIHTTFSQSKKNDNKESGNVIDRFID